MDYLEIPLVVTGVVLLVVGYRNNRRNILLAAAIILFLSGALGSFMEGVREGYLRNQAAHASRTSAHTPDDWLEGRRSPRQHSALSIAGSAALIGCTQTTQSQDRSKEVEGGSELSCRQRAADKSLGSVPPRTA